MTTSVHVLSLVYIGSGAAALESRVQMGVAVVSKSDDVKSLLDGVSNLLSSLPAVSRALEAVAKVHPFLESEFQVLCGARPNSPTLPVP